MEDHVKTESFFNHITKMIKCWYVKLLVLVLLTQVTLINKLNSQIRIDRRLEVIKNFKAFQLNDAKLILDVNFDYSCSSTVLKKEWLYYEKGVNTYPKKMNEFNHKTDYIDSIIYYNYLGDYYSRKLKPIDSLSFKNHVKAYNLSQKNKDTLLINESLRRINFFFIKNYKDKGLYNKYVNYIELYNKDSIDVFWMKYFKLVYDMSYSTFSKKEYKTLEDSFLNLKKETPNISYLQGIANQITGIFYTYKTNITASKLHFETAKSFFLGNSSYLKRRRIRAKYAIATLHFDEKNYVKLTYELKKILEDSLIKNDIELERMTYKWLEKTYDSLNDNHNRRYYSNLYNATNKIINDYAQAENAREISVRNQVEQTKKRNVNLSSKNKSLETKLLTIIPIFGIVTLILIFIFYLYKRYKKKNSILQVEQSETLQKLDELKNIVIKNHIILKDKTKVYISDLVYVKSDDHYLEIFIQNGKSHSVRGKLSQIKQELPPNFIQCHRSYIVNSNFIKQVNSTSLVLIDKQHIPLSRNYKNRF